MAIPARFASLSWTRGRADAGRRRGNLSGHGSGLGWSGVPEAPAPRRRDAHVDGQALTPMVPPEGLLVQSVLLEQPIGDAFLDRALWESTLPVGEPELRALLAENGLRVGILSGALPQRFQDLLHSESETVSPHALSFNARKEAVLPTAGPVDPCRFALLADLAGEPGRSS